MRYLSWAAFYEGPTDALYLDVLLPRIIRDVIATGNGPHLVDVPDVPAVKLGAKGRSIEEVSQEACSFRDAFEIVFVHADTGGRALEHGLPDRADAYCLALNEKCQWRLDRCLTITPRHETEAWLLADGAAITAALGYTGNPADVGLPTNPREAERLVDPKNTLRLAVEAITGRRRRERIENFFPAVAQ